MLETQLTLVLSSAALACALVSVLIVGRSLRGRDTSTAAPAAEATAPAAEVTLPAAEAAAQEEAVAQSTSPPAPAPYRELLTALPGMLYSCCPQRGVLPAGEGCEALTGVGLEALAAGAPAFADLVHPEDRDRVAEQRRSALSAGEAFQASYRLQTARGERWVWEKGQPAQRQGEAWLEGLILDITEQREAEARLLHDSFHDPLTGLANRHLLMDRLAQSARRARRRPGHAFALLVLDLDRFKLINDSLGHELGNQVLRITAHRLVASISQEHTVVRLGGDEFAVLLDEIADASDAVRLADRLGELLRLPVFLSGEEVIVSASIGIALSLSGQQAAEELLRDAEIAMYRAKAAGGGHELFDRAMHERAVARLRLESDLRRALKHRELRLVYQPILDFEDGRVRGFEALLRWQHPGRGLLKPEHFLNAAIESGQIRPITWWVLPTACRQVAAWQRMSPELADLYVSINLPGDQLVRRDLVERIQGVLFESGLAPKNLCLEITESVVIDHGDEVIGTLERLRELGIRLSLDDFGTGYSSLSSLAELPIHSVKIDRSFVADVVGGRHASREIVRAVISLAHNLEMEVVAEGVEAAEQATALKAVGCDYVQGYLYARPLPPQQAEELLAAGGDGLAQRYA